jgi:hypothetical protein
MFVNFQNDSGIRFSAHFYDIKADKVVKHPVSGWVTGDDGVSQATILVPSSGVQIRVGSFDDFLAVIPNGKEEEYQALVDAKVEALKKAIAEKSTDVSTSLAS